MDSNLKKLQMTELNILKKFDDFCKANHLHYSIYAGTLIGAVRHKGFIPWDDDIDICMSREEYNKFINIWDSYHPDGLVLQNKDNTVEFTQSFSKIRKNSTTFVQYEWEKGKYHTGIFIDIFPLDRVPKRRFSRFAFYLHCLEYQLYTREFVPSDAPFVVKLISYYLLKITSKKRRIKKRKNLLKSITKYNTDKSLPYVDTSVICTMKIDLPSDLFDNYVDMEFEGGCYKSFSKWDEYLSKTYGDYMKYPPKEEQNWKHHPIILDFEQSY